MFDIEKNVPLPPRYPGRKSKHRDRMIATMKAMVPGDSFRVEYKMGSVRNLIKHSGVEGVFRAATESDTHIRVWRIG